MELRWSVSHAAVTVGTIGMSEVGPAEFVVETVPVLHSEAVPGGSR